MPPSRKRGTVPRPRHATKREAKPRPFGRLERYEISGLFGEVDHSFELELEEPTILTGANGSGKSTILRTINAVSSGAWGQLFSVPFDSLRLKFEKAPMLRVTRGKESLKLEQGKREWRWKPEEHDPRQMTLAEADVVIGGMPVEIKRRREQEQLATYAYFAAARESLRSEETVPAWVREIRASFPVEFVTDQRLVLHRTEHRSKGTREQREEVRDAVSEYAGELAGRINHELARFGVAGEREAAAFPKILIEATAAKSHVNLKELHLLLDSIRKRRSDLERVGLVTEEEVPPEEQFEQASLEQEHVRPGIKAFWEMQLRTYDTIEPFRRRLQPFVDFLNQHFVDKRALASEEQGLIFELAGGDTVQPSSLSSGEQQMFVLAYRLLFRTSPGTLLLIDEPEISLHVGWQSSFLDDITEMGRDRHLQFLLATHSPVLIGGREDLKRSLDKSARR